MRQLLTRASLTRGQSSASGQVLVLAALMFVILIGITGFAIDISGAYLAQRWERSVADAASLAGGQDLQIPGSRALPTAAEYERARVNAMHVLVNELGATSTPNVKTLASPCLTAAGCSLAGTPYVVAIRTNPSPSCVDCDPYRAVQVAIHQPAFGLTFARIFGWSSWEVSATSVAGIVQTRQYGLLTLRPPRPRANGTDQNEKDIDVTGGSLVRVDDADIGTNTNLIISGINSTVLLQPGSRVWHYDPYQAWTSPPPGTNGPLILDPGYSIPQRTDVPTTPIYTDRNLNDAKLSLTDCQAEMAKVPPEYMVAGTPIKDMDPANVTCYKPGIYTRELSNNQNDEAVLLTRDDQPVGGVYFFDAGLDISTTLIGGYEGGQPGVALVLTECSTNNSCPFKGNNSILVALNFGSAYRNPAGVKATAAEWNFGLVETDSDPAVLMSLMVEPDPNCYVAPVEPSNSCSTSNNTLLLPGNGNLWVAGIQYAPTDNVQVEGNNSASEGVLGQVISWTIRFRGGSHLNLEAIVGETNGVLRLDAACSPTVALCNP